MPNFLVVTNVVPWPEVSGSTIRAAATVRALASLGTVDVFCTLHPSITSVAEPPGGQPVARWKGASIPRRPRSWRRFAWLFARGTPRELTGNDYSGPRRVFSDWIRPHYDLVWIVAGADGFQGFADLATGPVVVNLNDVEHSKIEALLEIDDLSTTGGDSGARMHRRVSRANLRMNAERWHAFYARMAEQVKTIVVCSDIDRDRLAEPTARVLPNVYPTPDVPLGRPSTGAPPTVSIVGQLHYAPNADAAAFFVRDVLPKLRAEIPGVQVRLVGEPNASVAALADVEGVTVTGLVPDIAAELTRADLSAVPIRFGGGTRIKILEAFAHRIPVVSTTLGAEGLGVVSGEHLLLADDASSFATACAAMLRDEELRNRVTAAAHAHWQERFTEAAFQAAVREVVGAIVPRRQPS